MLILAHDTHNKCVDAYYKGIAPKYRWRSPNAMSNDVLWPQSYFQSDQGECLSAHLKTTDSVPYSIQPKMNDLLQDYTIR